MNDNVQITLSKDEAIVLFELLSRFSDTDRLEIVHPSENRVLWNLQASLESILVEPFSEEYSVVLQNARRSIH